MLLQVLDIHPELVLEVGDVFARHQARAGKITAELKKLMDNPGKKEKTEEEFHEHLWRRTYAALLLILMGEI